METTDIKQCLRMLPKALDPIKKPIMNCVFRKEKECSLYPDYNRFLGMQRMSSQEKFKVEISEQLTLKVRCVLFNEYGVRI